MESEWTVVAHSAGLFSWSFEHGYDGASLRRSSERGDIIVMQRRVSDGFLLCIRPADAAWRKVQRCLMANPLPPRVVRR